MIIQDIKTNAIKNSAGKKTISVLIKTSKGTFSASSPSGESKGKHETSEYTKSLKESMFRIEKEKGKILSLVISTFSDLRKVEQTLNKDNIGADASIALQLAILKALAAENEKELWQIINPNAKKLPMPLGNIIGGGLHSKLFRKKKADFQEFLIIPRTRRFSDAVFIMEKAHEIAGKRLELRNSIGPLDDENAHTTSLHNEEILDVIKETKEEIERNLEMENVKISIGVDVAASTFYNAFHYSYENPKNVLNQDKQLSYMRELIEKFNIMYLEDPFNEEDFASFSKLQSSLPQPCLITGDDLTTTNLDRLKIAIKNKSINAIIIKPNQNGSLLDLAHVVILAKKNKIKTIFSHRSQETADSSLADLAFAFQADFIKTGVLGKERQAKLKRLIEIERGLGKK